MLINFTNCKHKTSLKEELKNESPTIDNISKKINAAPGKAELYYDRAKLYLEKKETDNALNDINKAITLDPDKAAYYCALSDINFAAGKITNCAEALNKALSLEPKNTEALLKLAELYFYFKKYDKTFEYINKALAVDKLNPNAYFMRAMALKEYGDTAKAVADFHTTVEQDPQNYDAYIELGLLYTVKKNHLALDYLDNALSISPNSIEALYAKAMFYQETADYNAAVETYTNIIHLDPKYKNAYYNLGYIYLVYLKNYNVAIDYFNKAIACDPAYAEAFYNRAYAFELKGDINNARSDYQKAIDIKPKYQKALDGMKRIGN